MAHADRNTLRRSKIELERQQRSEQPEVPGATGAPDLPDPGAAETKARKRHGRPQKHTSDDTPAAPRGRRRPDESLAREIHEILTKDPELDVAAIEVEVEGGAVTLSGEVDSSDARLLAEELVESVVGVREVHNRLRVARGKS